MVFVRDIAGQQVAPPNEEESGTLNLTSPSNLSSFFFFSNLLQSDFFFFKFSSHLLSLFGLAPPLPLAPPFEISVPCQLRSQVGPCNLKPSQSVLTRIKGSSSSFSSLLSAVCRLDGRLLSPSALNEKKKEEKKRVEDVTSGACRLYILFYFERVWQR